MPRELRKNPNKTKPFNAYVQLKRAQNPLRRVANRAKNDAKEIKKNKAKLVCAKINNKRRDQRITSKNTKSSTA